MCYTQIVMAHTLLLYKIFLPTAFAFLFGIFITPFFTHFFYKYKLWKRSSRSGKENNTGALGEMSQEFKQIHNTEKELHTPRVGGIIVWFSVIITIFIFYILSIFGKGQWALYLNLFSRNQTLLPLASMMVGAFIGLIDDFLQIFARKKELLVGGIPRKIRIALVIFLGAVEGIWFYQKLGYKSISVPFTHIDIYLGVFFILFFIFVLLALFSSSVIDGIDGLAAGNLSIIFITYGFIAIIEQQYNLAAFSFVFAGSLLAFLWFNIPPARFYLGETGILSLTLTLAVIIFLTKTEFLFLIIGFPLVISSASSFIQIIARRYFNKKVFHIAPFHHHLEYLGWSRERITMRYWIAGILLSLLSIILFILSH